jgi:hypothetical protein
MVAGLECTVFVTSAGEEYLSSYCRPTTIKHGRPLLHAKDIIWKDCARECQQRHFNKTVFSHRPHGRKKELEAGLIAVGAKNSL